jgi:hypothetical protein
MFLNIPQNAIFKSMNTVRDTFLFSLPLGHHAYFIEDSSLNTTREKIEAYIQKIYTFESATYDTLSIDDVRDLISRSTLSSPTPEKEHVFLIECFSIGHDASNALLKLLEEPRKGLHFIYKDAVADTAFANRNHLCV